MVECTGNLTIDANDTIFGILIVNGDLTLNSSSANVQGIVYMDDETSTLTINSSTSVQGAVICAGEIETGAFISSIVRHNPVYTQVFVNYLLNPAMPDGVKIWDWDY